ncbi:ABC transporter permease [Odoribacter laneus]|nr:ABC transporter permease [Odoribacter laneus]
MTKILSLTIGMVVGIVVLAYNLSVYSYDRFYEGADEIYRIQEWEIVNGQWEDYNWIIRAPLAPAMADHIPEIESATVVFGQESLEYQKGEDYIQAWTIYADTSFFNVFPRPLYAGNPAEDLVLPGQVFVSAKFAQKMFGDRQAVGQELVTEEGSWIVTGIFETVPENTHLYFDVVR